MYGGIEKEQPGLFGISQIEPPLLAQSLMKNGSIEFLLTPQ